MRQFNIHSFPEFVRQCVDDSIFVIFGEERYFCDQMLHIVEERFLDESADRNLNYQQFYGTENTISEIISACLSFPMFAEHKLVVIKEFDKLRIEDKESFLKYITKPQTSTKLVLVAEKWDSTKFYKQILNSAISVHCKTLSSAEVYEWVEYRLHMAKLEVDPKSITFLIENIGANVLRLNLEIEKIVNYLGPGQKVSLDVLTQLTGFTRDLNIFNFQRALGLRDLKTSLNIGLRLLEQGESMAAIIPMLFIFFRRIWVVKHLQSQNYSQAQILSKLGGSKFAYQDIFVSAKKFSNHELINIFRLLQRSDIELKSSQKIHRSILTMICYSVCDKKTVVHL
jgi:DNA polymerase-3 subunit delta